MGLGERWGEVVWDEVRGRGYVVWDEVRGGWQVVWD